MNQPDKVVGDDITPVAKTRLTTERVQTQQVGESAIQKPYSFLFEFLQKDKKEHLLLMLSTLLKVFQKIKQVLNFLRITAVLFIQFFQLEDVMILIHVYSNIKLLNRVRLILLSL